MSPFLDQDYHIFFIRHSLRMRAGIISERNKRLLTSGDFLKHTFTTPRHDCFFIT